MDIDNVLDKLFNIIEELDARNCSNNSVIPELGGRGWNELCKDGIELFEQIGGKEG